MRRILIGVGLAAIGLAPVPATAETGHQCFGEVPTVVGTHGSDSLTGDVVVGRGGQDVLSGRLVCGNSGSDLGLSGYMVNGGPGDDVPMFLRGPVALGGDGNDEIKDGGYDGQTFWGGEGDDEIILRTDGIPDVDFTETEVVYAGPGNDLIDKEDTVQPSRQYGQDGNDELAGGFGRDELYGGPGDDFLRHFSATRDDHVPDLLRGGEGFDTCVVFSGDKAISCEDVTVVS
jgi:Ca2+-binding RTX toxin-like protein